MAVAKPFDGSTFDASGDSFARASHAPTLDRPYRVEPRAKGRFDAGMRVGIICNKRAHRNLTRDKSAIIGAPGVECAVPSTPDDLSRTLASFAERRINVLIVDGGDGTVRDVLTAASAHFHGAFPAVAVLASGKTNALALDLGVTHDWTIEAAIQAVREGRFTKRSPIEVSRAGEATPFVRGFLFGAGAFVRATDLAQDTHRFGAFNGLAVGLTLTGAIAQTLIGGRNNPWRRGERMRVMLDDGRTADQPFYMMLGSTLERLPLDIKPFGQPRRGFKLLGIDAPPKRLLLSLPALLSGSEAPWLDRVGYHRADVDSLDLTIEHDFVLDGETYRGGALTLRKGAPISFAMP